MDNNQMMMYLMFGAGRIVFHNYYCMVYAK